MNKKLKVGLLCVFAITMFSAGALATGGLEAITAYKNTGLKIVKDNQILDMRDANGNKVYPITYNDSTYLPARAISSVYGVSIDWDAGTNAVLVGGNNSQFLSQNTQSSSNNNSENNENINSSGKISGTGDLAYVSAMLWNGDQIYYTVPSPDSNNFEISNMWKMVSNDTNGFSTNTLMVKYTKYNSSVVSDADAYLAKIIKSLENQGLWYEGKTLGNQIVYTDRNGVQFIMSSNAGYVNIESCAGIYRYRVY